MRLTDKHRQAVAAELLAARDRVYDETYRQYHPSQQPPPPPPPRSNSTRRILFDDYDTVRRDLVEAARQQARADKVADLKAVCGTREDS